MSRLLSLMCAVVLLAGTSAHADVTSVAPPEGLFFVGLVGGQWRMVVVESQGKLRHIVTTSEPRTPAYSEPLGRAAYISAAGELRELDLATGKDTALLLPSSKVAYTQPAYRPGTDELYVVALRDGSSVETDLGRVERAAKKLVVVLQQRSAQFEPAFTRDGAQLIYSNVLCASECPKIIQEIWVMDVVGGATRQLTLLNAVSRQPAAGISSAVVFASNANGYYQLWRIQPGAAAQQLTREAAVDESPAITASGDIYFVRRTANGGRLMRLTTQGEASPIKLDDSITDVRDVRWGR